MLIQKYVAAFILASLSVSSLPNMALALSRHLLNIYLYSHDNFLETAGHKKSWKLQVK